MPDIYNILYYFKQKYFDIFHINFICSDGNDIDQTDKKLRRKKAVKSKRRHTTVSWEQMNK